jgi:hypothetical protein
MGSTSFFILEPTLHLMTMMLMLWGAYLPAPKQKPSPALRS